MHRLSLRARHHAVCRLLRERMPEPVRRLDARLANDERRPLQLLQMHGAGGHADATGGTGLGQRAVNLQGRLPCAESGIFVAAGRQSEGRDHDGALFVANDFTHDLMGAW
jgi:hypothetical protein